MAWLFNWRENIRTFVPVSIDKDVSCYAMFFSARPVRFCDAISLVKTGKFLLKFKIIVIVTMSCVLSLRWTIECGSGMRKAREFRWVNSRIQVYFLKSKHTYVHRLQMKSNKGKGVKTNSCEVNFWGSSCYRVTVLPVSYYLSLTVQLLMKWIQNVFDKGHQRVTVPVLKRLIQTLKFRWTARGRK